MIKHNDIIVRRRNRANGDLEYQGVLSIDKSVLINSELYPVNRPLTINFNHDGDSIADTPNTYTARVAPDPGMYDAPLVNSLQGKVFDAVYGELKPLLRDLLRMADNADPRLHAIADKLHELELL